jgi:hypothetical protein
VFDPDEIPNAKGKMNCPLSDEVSMGLNAMRPYPGDPVWESCEVDRFHVYRTANDKLVVMDLVTNEDDLLLDMNRVWKKDFKLGQWDAVHRTMATKVRVHRKEKHWFKRLRFNKDLWAENTACHMNAGMEYMDYRTMDVGDDTLDYQFDVSEMLDDVFSVFDAKSGLQFECQLGNLKNLAWDVQRWFYKQVRTQCIWDFHRRMESDSYDLCKLFGYEKLEEEEAKTKLEFGEHQPFTIHNIELIGFDTQFNT